MGAPSLEAVTKDSTCTRNRFDPKLTLSTAPDNCWIVVPAFWFVPMLAQLARLAQEFTCYFRRSSSKRLRVLFPEQNDLLLGQAMQCAGMIGEAVGRTRFRSDGLAMMSTLMVRTVPPRAILLQSSVLRRPLGYLSQRPKPCAI